MAGLKVTREVHTQIQAIIAKNKGASNAEIARKTGVSDKTIRRIRSSRSYIGYKRQLKQDHPWRATDEDMPPSENMAIGVPQVRRHKVGFLSRLKALRG